MLEKRERWKNPLDTVATLSSGSIKKNECRFDRNEIRAEVMRQRDTGNLTKERTWEPKL